MDKEVEFAAAVCTEILTLTPDHGKRMWKLLHSFAQSISGLSPQGFPISKRIEFLDIYRRVKAYEGMKALLHTERNYSEIKENARAVLEILPSYSPPQNVEGSHNFLTPSQVPIKNAIKMQESRNAVFVVHGHDEKWKHQIARFLSDSGITPIILHEQPNEGKTTIEKLESHSQVRFAVVILSGDDRGKLSSAGKYSPRARQNVIMELGYFLAKLGRNNVCALYEEGVEIPSDFTGVLYVSLNGGAWKSELARELRHVGFDVNIEALLK